MHARSAHRSAAFSPSLCRVHHPPQLRTWHDFCHAIKKREVCAPDDVARLGVTIFAYANNHYAGHVPATVALFMKLWDKSR